MPRLAFAALLLLLFAARLPGQEVWHIALRPDGQEGSGSVGDPFDGSTPERLATAFQRIPERRLTVRLGEGIFVTRTTLDVKSGWTVAGAGPTRTTLRLADEVLPKAGESILILGRYDHGGPPTLQEWACVRDLAIDGNRQGQRVYRVGADGNINALCLYARDGRFENVHVRNTFSRPGEGFPVTIYSTGGTVGQPNRAEIVGVWVDRHEGPATSIAAFDQTGGRLTGGIRRCRVTGYGRMPSGVAFGAGGWQDFAIEDNRVEGMSAGMVIDTHNYADVRISRNRFLRCWKFGILMNGSGQYERISITRNRIQVLARAQEPGAILKFDKAVVRDLLVTDNDLTSNRYGVPLETGPAAQGVIGRNRLAPGARFRVPRGSGILLR